MEITPSVKMEKVCFHYEDDGPEAVSDVSLRVRPGEMVAVLGHNGSGKSTLAKLLNALLVPTDGTVAVMGMDTRDDTLTYSIRQAAGMVFQNPDNQLVANQVEEDVAFGLENIGVPTAEMPSRITDALGDVRMTEYIHRAPHTLSGGQKQRVAIAGVLAMRPDVLILDEATAMLDPLGRREVLDTVCRLNKQNGITVVMITHFMEEAVECDRVFVMNEGAVVMSGAPGEVFRRVDELRALRLDVPPMAALAHDLRKAGMPIADNVMTLEQMTDTLCEVLCPSK